MYCKERRRFCHYFAEKENRNSNLVRVFDVNAEAQLLENSPFSLNDIVLQSHISFV